MNLGHRIVATRGGLRLVRAEGSSASKNDFWPEICSHSSQEELVRAACKNSPGRVFFEVVLVLGIAGLMAVAAILWIPIIS